MQSAKAPTNSQYNQPSMSNLSYPTISGPVPGVLDPTQPSRILRHESSILAFLTYDPCTAGGRGQFYKAAQSRELLAQRVVAEQIPGEFPTWKFVPSARRDTGLEDEGVWPRIVNICG